MSGTLLVEGVDDQEVIKQLLGHWSYSLIPGDSNKRLRHSEFGNLTITQEGGFGPMLQKLDVYWRGTNTLNLGLVVDRDLDLDAKPNPWPSLRNRVLEFAPELKPQLPPEQGPLPKEGIVVVHETGRKLGIWVMPDNETLGTIETFFTALIPSTDRLWPRAKSAVTEIPAADRKFGEKSAKAEVHTWLAWQEDPGARMGSAINKRYLNAKAETATAFVEWLEKLLAP